MNDAEYGSDKMSRGGVIASFAFGALALMVVAAIAAHLQNAPPPPAPPRITIVTTDTVVKNPFSIRFVTDQPVRNGPLGIEWGTLMLHAHLMVDSMMFMPGTFMTRGKGYRDDVVVGKRDTFFILAPHLAAGPHTLRLFWANMSHANVGDTAIIRVNVIQ